MARGPYVMTPAREAALRKAQLASAAARKARKAATASSRVPTRPRPTGFKQLIPHAVPYARVNKRSQTIGVNAGTIIPGTHKRFVVGGYARLESTKRKTVVDQVLAKGGKRAFPANTRRGKAARAIKSSIVLHGPVVRATAYGHQVRVGTSRGAGPTVIVRRGKHKVPKSKSKTGVHAYNNRMAKIAMNKASAKTPRPQRRKAARKKSS